MTEVNDRLARAETLSSAETLFPFAPETVIEGLENLRDSSNQMLDMIIYARGSAGAANELYANLPSDDLVVWHRENQDFGEAGSILYKAGLLYGIDLAVHAASDMDVSPPMRLENPDAFTRALDYLKESYRGLDDSLEKPEWLRQKERELRYTGSDVLSLANAALHHKTLMRLWERGYEDSHDVLAQHVGIVDGVILVDAYRAFLYGRQPFRFDSPVQEYVPSFDPTKHIGSNTADFTIQHEPQSFDDILRLIAEVRDMSDEPYEGMLSSGATVYGTPKLAQVGVDSFVRVVEIESATLPAYNLKRIGLAALLGAGVGVVMNSRNRLPLRYVPAMSLMAAVTALGVEHAVRRGVRDKLATDNVLVVSRQASSK